MRAIVVLFLLFFIRLTWRVGANSIVMVNEISVSPPFKDYAEYIEIEFALEQKLFKH